MSKRRRNRPVHHEDLVGLTPLSPLALRALQPQHNTTVTKPVAVVPPKPLNNLVSALAQTVLPSAVKSGAAVLSNPAALAALSKTPSKTATASSSTAQVLTSAQQQKIANATAKISSSTARLRASASKNKKLSGKLSKIASVLDNKAGSLKSAATKLTPAATHRLMGVDIATLSFDGNALLTMAVQMIAQGSEADALSVAADINQEMADDLTQLATLQQTQQVANLISQATTFGNNAYDIVNNYDPTAGDPSVPTRVAALQTQVNAWHSSLTSALGDKTLNPAVPGSTLPGATTPPGSTTPVPGMMSLTQAMGPNDLVAYVNTTVGAPPQGIIQIDSEQIAYLAVTPNSFNGLQRAYNPTAGSYGSPYGMTPPASHAAGAMVSFAYQGQGAGGFDPGQYGGGGGGGGGGGDDWPDDGGGSDAVSQFRQGVDPFADEDDDGSAPVTPDGSDGGTYDDGSAYDGSSDAGMSQDDLDRALLEQDDSGDAATSSTDLLSQVQTDDDSALASEGATPGGTFSEDDYALLEADSPEVPDAIIGSGFWDNWSQLFYNPAGLLMDAVNPPAKSKFQVHVASPTTTSQWRGSSGAQANLTAAQQRLAQTQAALQAGRTAYLQQLMSEMGQPGALPQSSAPPPTSSLSRYSGSGAFVGPIPSDWSAPQPQPADQGGSMPTDDGNALSPDSVVGLTPNEVETVCCGVEGMTGHDLSDEMADIVVDSYQHQITDASPSFERGPASRHGGAAYLDPTYPRGGSVAGRQGGLIQPEEKIIVGHNKDVFFGGCYEHGLDVLGANVAANAAMHKLAPQPTLNKTAMNRVPPRAGFVQQTTPKGRKFMSLKVLNPKHHDHTTSIKNARDAGKRAVSIADKVDKQIKKTAVAVHKTAIKGDLIGASKAVARGVAHHLLTSAQLLKATKSARDLGNKAIKAADKHQKTIDTLNAKNKAGAATARKKLKMGSSGKATVIHGVDDEAADVILGAQLDVIFGACVPDPSDPGWCMDGTVDPNYGGAGGNGGYLPPGYGAPSAPPDPNNPGYLTDGTPDPNYAGGAQTAGPPDYGLGPAPTAQTVEPQPNIDYVADPFPGAEGDINQYSSDPSVPGTPLPVGAVIYDGSNPPGYMSLGSYTTFFGQLPGGAPPAGGAGPVMPVGGSYASGGSGYQWHDDGWYSFRKDDYAGPAGSGDQRLKNADDSGAGTGPARANNSFQYNWGPMIGNPNGALRGLRYDIAGNQWFWYYDAAPDWAKAPIRQALINQAILDYQAQLAAAAADYASQQAADKLAAEQAQQLMQQQALEDSEMQHEMELQQQQAQQDASVQALADQAQAQQQQAQDDSYARQTDAEAQAEATLEQSQALTQAKIEQQAAETAARLDAMAAAQGLVSPDADAGDSAYVPDDGSYDDSGDAAPYDGYSNAKDMLDSEE